jgi:glycosyltransferase involved in cell wall biosynthesis
MACDASVVVTAYDQAALLQITLGCLERQDYRGVWEVVICDDGSREDTLREIKNVFRAGEVPVRYVWQARDGERRARSRNNALRCANGRVVILIDGDIAVPSDFVSRHMALHTGGRTVVYGTRRWLFLADVPPGLQVGAVIDSHLTVESGASTLFSEEWLFQEKFAHSSNPWRACMGCNFSFSRDDVQILFDETFVGWGYEDIEFAYRLHELYGYCLQFAPSIFGLHLDHSSRSDFAIFRPTSHRDIGQLLRNVIHFYDLYPHLDVVVACEILGHFEYNPSTDIWSVAQQSDYARCNITSIEAAARLWLARHTLELADRNSSGANEQMGATLDVASSL